MACVAIMVSGAIAFAEAPTEQVKPTAEPGMSKEAAIEVCGVGGERAYLQKLRCTDDSPPTFERSGSVGPRNDIKTKEDEALILKQMMSTQPLTKGEKDVHTIDNYEVACRDKKVDVYLDMYHCPEPKSHTVPPGFSLKGQKP